MKQTSIEWLWEQIDGIIPYQEIKTSQLFNGVLEQAKEMHKQEIIDAHIEGQRVFDKHDHTQWTTDQAEQYYQETFKKD